MITKIATSSKQPMTLMKVFNFTLADLNANKAGTLSKRQIRLAEATQPNPLVQLVLMGHVGIIIGVLALITFASGVTTERLLFLGVAGMVILSPFLYAMNRVNMMQSTGLSADDLADNEVLSVCGEITFHAPVGLNASAKLEVGSMTFTLPKGASDLLNLHASYCVYYAAHSKRIVSIEAVGES